MSNPAASSGHSGPCGPPVRVIRRTLPRRRPAWDKRATGPVNPQIVKIFNEFIEKTYNADIGRI